MTIVRSGGATRYPIALDAAPDLWTVVREVAPDPSPKPRLLDRVRQRLRARHYSRRTEKAYIFWIKRYIFFHGKRHPVELGAPEVTAFLTALAVRDRVAASPQNQALCALLFLYRDVLGVELPWLEGLVRAKRPEHLPVVLTIEEVRAVLERMHGVTRLMALLLYGTGLRLLECCRLRVQDVDFAKHQLLIRDGKGGKDRVTMLPVAARDALSRHLARVRGSTRRISDRARDGSSSHGHWHASIRTPAGNGCGSGSFRPPGSTSSAPPASAAGITSTSPFSSGP